MLGAMSLEFIHNLLSPAGSGETTAEAVRIGSFQGA